MDAIFGIVGMCPATLVAAQIFTVPELSIVCRLPFAGCEIHTSDRSGGERGADDQDWDWDQD